MLIYNPQTSFPNNEPTDVRLGIKAKSTFTLDNVLSLSERHYLLTT